MNDDRYYGQSHLLSYWRLHDPCSDLYRGFCAVAQAEAVLSTLVLPVGCACFYLAVLSDARCRVVLGYHSIRDDGFCVAISSTDRQYTYSCSSSNIRLDSRN